MHVPQSLVSANELREIAAVPYQIMSPRECKPIIGVVQDTALGVYRMTKEYVLMDDKAFFNLMARNSLFTGILPKPAEEVDGVRRWSGRQALSSIIPKNINIKSPNRSFDDNVPGGDKENFVIVQNGEIVQGRVDASIYQNRTKGLIHSIYNECGADETRKFFDNTQTMICDFLVNNGFSVGISDLVVDDKDKEELKKVIHDMKVKVYDIIRNIHMGHFENKSIENNNDYFEQEVNQILNQANTKAGKLGMAKIDDATNRMINMVKSGSKGNVINVAQMLACLGQQNVDGKRIVYGFDSRTLPHYTKYDDGPESRGFVENSFVQGLSPQEFFFHAMGGREGLIDTAVRTSESGYLQRKLVKAMEDCKIAHDGTVRNASGSIVQFLYGEDGMNPTKIESQSLPYIEMDYATLCKEYLIAPEDDLKYILNDKTIKELKGVDGWEDRMHGHFEQILDDREFMIERIFHNQRDNSILYPVSFARIINTSKIMFSGKGVLSDLNPLYVLDKVEELCKELVVGGHFNPGNKLIQILIRCFLSPKQMVCVNKFDKMIFDYIYSQVKAKFFEAINDPSDMVGVIAAQSIGEPVSQLSITNRQIVRVSIRNKKTHEFSFYNGEVGKFIDSIHNEYKEYVVDVPDHDGSTVIPMKYLDKEIYIVGVSDDEKTSWKKVSEVSRHPANGGLVKITTRSGKSTTATLSHSFLKRTESKIVPIKGSDLKVGDRVPVAKKIPQVKIPSLYHDVNGEKQLLDFDLGWLCGAYIADGFTHGHKVEISKVNEDYRNNVKRIVEEKFNTVVTERWKKNKIDLHPAFKDKEYEGCDNIFTSQVCAELFKTFGTHSHDKIVAPWVFGANRKFIRGVISGYFDGDGNVQADDRGKNMIRSGSTSEKLTEDMIVLLSYVGIFASKCLEKKNKKIYGDKCMDLHTIQIPGKYCHLFKENIGFATGYKQQDLLKMIEYFDREDKYSEREQIDKIPELGEAIAFIGKTLALPGQSRNYGRWKKKEAIGRRTLQKYIKIFEEENAKQQNKEVAEKIKILRQAVNSDVIWDEIVDIEYLPDPKEYVYDFTVPGNDSFVVDTNIIVHNTLNSVHYDTDILFRVNGELQKTKIGEYIDKKITTLPPDHIEDHPKDTKLAWIKDDLVEVLSCDKNGQVKWQRVEAVTRHPVVNKDGSSSLLKITTESGRQVICTKAKSLLMKINNEVIPVDGESLMIGHHVPVSSILPIGEAKSTYNYHDGYQLALNLPATLPIEYYKADIDFVNGLMDGLFGEKYGEESHSGDISTLQLAEELQQLLVKWQHFTWIKNTENGNYCLMIPTFKHSVPNTQIQTNTFGEIIIPRHSIHVYMDQCKDKKDREILEKAMNETVFYDKIIDIQVIPNDHPWVYDLTVENTRTFNAFNGICCDDTFHSSGVSSASKAVRGVPRMKELLSVSKNQKTPSLRVHLKPDIATNKNKAKEIMNTIQTTLFADIVKSSKIYYDPDDFKTTIEDDAKFVNSYREFVDRNLVNTTNNPWLLRFEFDKEKMLDYSITMLDVHAVLQDHFDNNIITMFSDDNADQLIFRIRLPSQDPPKKGAAAADEDGNEKDYITELKALEKSIMENLIVKGIKKIQKAALSKQEYSKYNKETMQFEKTFEWVIDTAGTNLIDVLGHNSVDPYKTMSNDIIEIYELFGIEAARQTLYHELNAVINDGQLYINYRHIGLLVDTMTNRGYLMSIDRHGINRVDIGPLAKCSFEEVTDMLTKAGMFAEIDRITGISANVILGQIPQCGTGDTQIVLDHDKVIALSKDTTIKISMDDVTEDPTIINYCAVENLTFDFTLPDPDPTIKKLKLPQIKVV